MERTFRPWKELYGDFMPSEVMRDFAKWMLDKEMLQEVVRRKR